MRAAATAFVDESFRRGLDGHGLFLLSAVIVPDDRLLDIKSTLRRQVAPGQQRCEIHWAITAGVANASLKYRHDPPVQEPLLWLPDAIAGAVGISIADRSDELVSLLPAPLRQVRGVSA